MMGLAKRRSNGRRSHPCAFCPSGPARTDTCGEQLSHVRENWRLGSSSGPAVCFGSVRGGGQSLGTRRRIARITVTSVSGLSEDREKAHASLPGKELLVGTQPLRAYDAAAICEYYDARPELVLLRLASIGWPLVGWTLRYRVLRGVALNAPQTEQSAAALVQVITKMGATMVKVGQLISNRPDIVTDITLFSALQTLQDRVAPFPDDEARRIVLDEFGVQRLDEVYASFSDAPIAAASLGQVYSATLRAEGSAPPKKVAVKVQRPNIEETARLDLYILRKLAAYGKRRLGLRSDMVAVVDEFGRLLMQEIDYENEARNCNKFYTLYGNGVVTGVVVPRAYEQLTTRRVLTMDFVEGRTLKVQGQDSRALIESGILCSLKQLLDDGFYQVDPHAGNLLRTPDGQLAYIDFGMMAQVDEKTRFALIGSIAHLINKQWDLLAKDFDVLGFLGAVDGTTTQESQDLKVADVAATLQRAFRDASPDGKLKNISFGALTKTLSQVTRSSPIRLPSYFALVIRSLAILEGLGLAADPNFRIVDSAVPYVSRRLLNDRAPELVQAMQEVVLDPVTGRIRWSRLKSLLQDSGMQGFQVRRPDNVPTHTSVPARDVASPAASAGEAQNDRMIAAAVEFFLSANGRFLRDALLKDLTDLIDDLQLASGRAISDVTRGIIPPPVDVADPERVQFAKDVLAALLQRGTFFSAGSLVRAEERRADHTETRRSGVAQEVIMQLISRRDELLEAIPPLESSRYVAGELLVRASTRFWKRVKSLLLASEKQGFRLASRIQQRDER
ncbi:Uncharacterized protein FVE85_2939 [Porphyridium purpureum]|uniref:ABC1 atypical kinase-like domain-containing protein n=1 Tax=Porphyridium purpureum TaxID=35688 RepID=A0A5J4YU32_PORPP|nr:Uncharacterized protein FVE85_2939 [Porphyridium purpureum]|eukprot:POR7734..scf227_4